MGRVSDPHAPVTPPAVPQVQPGAPAVPPYSGPYAAPYVAPVHPQYAAVLTPAAPRRSAALGIVALIAAGLAALTPVVAAIAAFQIGLGAGKGVASRPVTATWDWSILTPVRDWVLLGEASFWVGTALGVWAIVQGIIAIVRRSGRIAGIVAVVIAMLAPIVFGLATWISLAGGLEAGGSIGG